MMLSIAAPRSTQLAGVAPPPVLRELEVIRDALGLGPDECIADSLVACGLGAEPTAHEVAACAQRFLEHATDEAIPDAVILRGWPAYHLARAAGLVDSHPDRSEGPEQETVHWRPIGVSRSASIIIHGSDRYALKRTIRHLAEVLGLPRRPLPPHPCPRPGAEQELLHVLGRHTGMRRKGHRGKWNTIAGVALKPLEVRAHLNGRYWVAPFSPMHEWSFVGVDIDRHNAVQELHFEKTLERARKALPNALVFQSGSSHGAHLYVHVPDGWKYKDAALVVRAYFAFLGLLRKRDKTHDGRLVVTEFVEVPAQPLRLPFGRGNKLWADTRPIDEQLDTFLAYVRGADFRAFEQARARVFRELELEGEWTAAKAEKINEWLHEEELRHLKREKLPSDDPWTAVLDELPPYLAKIATIGSPSYGSRSRWTRELIRALADLRPREEVERLMTHWVSARPHVSEDIENNVARAVRQTMKFIASHYRSLGGVPERVWREVDDAVRTAYAMAADSEPDKLRATAQGGTLRLEDLRKTAFFILRRFYAKRKRTLSFHHDMYFQRFTGTNTSRQVKLFLTESGTWLRFGRGAVQGTRSDEFILRDDLWLAAPSEPLLYPLPSGI
ncbi:hypothetical protein [Sorangium cellulosum]|uniref:hypothetical protein n=1 Tax=Sorangium cellulosum TaxID=56 RepID=UPI0013318CA1|nr:hypothetical protein [Sorangium cellulosum]